MEVQRSWLYMCCACVIATWRLGLRTPPVSANWKKRTHQKNCLLHHEPFVVWLDGVQEDIEPKWYQPLWCHDPEKNRRNIWFNIGSEFKARWMKKRERRFFSQWHRRLRGKNPSTPNRSQTYQCRSRPWDKRGGGVGGVLQKTNWASVWSKNKVGAGPPDPSPGFARPEIKYSNQNPKEQKRGS